MEQTGDREQLAYEINGTGKMVSVLMKDRKQDPEQGSKILKAHWPAMRKEMEFKWRWLEEQFKTEKSLRKSQHDSQN